MEIWNQSSKILRLDEYINFDCLKYFSPHSKVLMNPKKAPRGGKICGKKTIKKISHVLTWLDLTWLWYRSSKLRRLKWYRVAQVARISPEEANWTNEPLKQPLTTHLRMRIIVSRNQQQEFHTLLAIIISY